MIETIPIPQEQTFEENSFHKDSNFGYFNFKLNQTIKNSTALFEQKSKFIMKELNNLKTEYLYQLNHLSSCFNIKNNQNIPGIKNNQKEISAKKNLEKKNTPKEIKNIPVVSSNAISRSKYCNNSILAAYKKKEEFNTISGFNNSNKRKRNSDTSNTFFSAISNNTVTGNKNECRSNVADNCVSVKNKTGNKTGKFNSMDKNISKTYEKNKKFANLSYNSNNQKQILGKSVKFSTEFNSKKESISQSPSKNIINNIKFDFNFQEIDERKKSFEIFSNIGNGEFSILDTKKAFRQNNPNSTNLSKLDTLKLDTCIVNDYSPQNQRLKYIVNSSAGKLDTLAKKKFSDKYAEIFFLLARSKVVNLRERLIFASLNRSSKIVDHPREEIIKDYYHLIRNSIHKTEKELLDNKINEDSIMKKLSPSITAQNCLNFFTKKVQASFINSGSEEVKNIIRCIYILLNYEINDFNQSNEFLIKNLLQKFKLGDLSKNYFLIKLESLFFKVIYLEVFIKNSISPLQISNFNLIINKCSKLLKPSEISNINLGASYISYSIKEIYEYLNMIQTEEGKKIHNWKIKIQNLNKILAEEEKLKEIIHGKIRIY